MIEPEPLDENMVPVQWLSYAIIEHMNTTNNNLTWRETADRIRESRIGKYEIWVHEAVNIMACIPDTYNTIQLKQDILKAIDDIDNMDDFNASSIRDYRIMLSPVLKRIIPFMEQQDDAVMKSYEQGEETTDYSEILFADYDCMDAVNTVEVWLYL